MSQAPGAEKHKAMLCIPLGTMPSAPLLLGQAYRSPNIGHTSKTRQGKAQSRARSAALYSLSNSCSLTAKNALLLIPLQAGSMGEGFAKDFKRLSLCGEWRELQRFMQDGGNHSLQPVLDCA
ncbi:hypothetical protein [Comamonas sp.]|uniref:hypothetical protein n=1 Tax=Comamonas sp. TaxID=34028 RepID=UPI00289C2955|nr:hypothetical protein [Comamonas sp.]